MTDRERRAHPVAGFLILLVTVAVAWFALFFFAFAIGMTEGDSGQPVPGGEKAAGLFAILAFLLLGLAWSHRVGSGGRGYPVRGVIFAVLVVLAVGFGGSLWALMLPEQSSGNPLSAGDIAPGVVVLAVVLVGGLWLAWWVGTGYWGRRPPLSPAPVDGPSPAVFVPCPGCGRTVNREEGRCPYCQTQVLGGGTAKPEGPVQGPVPAAEVAQLAPPLAYWRASEPGAQLRSEIGGQVIAHLAGGTLVQEVGRQGLWVKVISPQGTGWVPKAALFEQTATGRRDDLTGLES